MVGRRREIGAIGLCIAALGAILHVPAHAAPHAGRTVRGEATFAIKGTDGVKRTLSVIAEESTGAAEWAYLEVHVQACTKTTCTEANTYGKTLATSELELSSDGSSARLETEFAGEPLAITWMKPSTVTSLSAEVGAPDSITIGSQSDATVSARMLAFACNSGGELADVVEAYSDRQPPVVAREPKSLPKGFAPRGKVQRPSCAD